MSSRPKHCNSGTNPTRSMTRTTKRSKKGGHLDKAVVSEPVRSARMLSSDSPGILSLSSFLPVPQWDLEGRN
ncbi:hypothetical protein K1719_037655 [Acacia pycnantha]|nr:hypothetical protein K1719_037655 [Acacia pycnantha]